MQNRVKVGWVSLAIFLCAAGVLMAIYVLIWKKPTVTKITQAPISLKDIEELSASEIKKQLDICQKQVCSELLIQLEAAQKDVEKAQTQYKKDANSYKLVKIDEAKVSKQLKAIKADVLAASQEAGDLYSACKSAVTKKDEKLCATCIQTLVGMNKLLGNTLTDVKNLRGQINKANTDIKTMGTEIGTIGKNLANVNAEIIATETAIRQNMRYSKMYAVNLEDLKNLTAQIQNISSKIADTASILASNAANVTSMQYKSDTFQKQSGLLEAYDSALSTQIQNTRKQTLAAKDLVASFKDNEWTGMSMGGQAYNAGMYYNPSAGCPISLRRPLCGTTTGNCVYTCNPTSLTLNPVYVFAESDNKWWNAYIVSQEIGPVTWGTTSTLNPAPTQQMHQQVTAVLENEWSCNNVNMGIFISGFIGEDCEPDTTLAINDNFDPGMFLWVGRGGATAYVNPECTYVKYGLKGYCKTKPNTLCTDVPGELDAGNVCPGGYWHPNTSCIFNEVSATKISTKLTDLKNTFSNGNGFTVEGSKTTGPVKVIIQLDSYPKYNVAVVSCAMFSSSSFVNGNYIWNSNPVYKQILFSVPLSKRLRVGLITSVPSAVNDKYVAKFSGVSVTTSSAPWSSSETACGLKCSLNAAVAAWKKQSGYLSNLKSIGSTFTGSLESAKEKCGKMAECIGISGSSSPGNSQWKLRSSTSALTAFSCGTLDGSNYSSTCGGCSSKNGILSCSSCNTRWGDEQKSSVSYVRCKGVENNDGHLQCIEKTARNSTLSVGGIVGNNCCKLDSNTIASINSNTTYKWNGTEYYGKNYGNAPNNSCGNENCCPVTKAVQNAATEIENTPLPPPSPVSYIKDGTTTGPCGECGTNDCGVSCGTCSIGQACVKGWCQPAVWTPASNVKVICQQEMKYSYGKIVPPKTLTKAQAMANCSASSSCKYIAKVSPEGWTPLDNNTCGTFREVYSKNYAPGSTTPSYSKVGKSTYKTFPNTPGGLTQAKSWCLSNGCLGLLVESNSNVITTYSSFDSCGNHSDTNNIVAVQSANATSYFPSTVKKYPSVGTYLSKNIFSKMPGAKSNNMFTSTGTNCPIDGIWSEWSEWSSCDSFTPSSSSTPAITIPCYLSTSGKQIPQGCMNVTPEDKGYFPLNQIRVRTCNNPAPKFGGKFCSGSSLQRRSCPTGCVCKSAKVSGYATKYINHGVSNTYFTANCHSQCSSFTNKTACTNYTAGYSTFGNLCSSYNDGKAGCYCNWRENGKKISSYTTALVGGNKSPYPACEKTSYQNLCFPLTGTYQTSCQNCTNENGVLTCEWCLDSNFNKNYNTSVTWYPKKISYADGKAWKWASTPCLPSKGGAYVDKNGNLTCCSGPVCP